MNHVFLLGRLGKDVELKYTPSGTEVATFSLATSEKWTDKEGKKQEQTEWHRIVAWRGLAKVCAEYLHKGDQVLIEGKIRTRSWEKDGQKMYATEIQAMNMEFCQKAGSGGSGAGQKAAEPGDEDIPF